MDFREEYFLTSPESRMASPESRMAIDYYKPDHKDDTYYNDNKYLQNKLERTIEEITALKKEVDSIVSELKALSNYFNESEE